MRKNTKDSIRLNHIIIIFIIFLMFFFPFITLFSTLNAQGNELVVIVSDLEENTISEIIEGEYFKISVINNESKEQTPYVTDVTILFNDKEYYINDSFELSIIAPNVVEDRGFIIIATKEGFNSSYGTLQVLNNITGKLNIIPEKYVVNSEERFSIQVLDQGNNPISMVAVGIQSTGDISDISYTDDEGRAWLTAPEESGIIKIVAQKNGYTQDIASIEVNIIPPWYSVLINNPFFPIIIASIILIIIIILVHFRQKRSIYEKTDDISNEKSFKKIEEINLKKQRSPNDSKKEYYSMDNIRVQQDSSDSKVEEIRISRPKKEKEIVSLKTVEDEIDKVIAKKKITKGQHDWFIGHDELKYEIDKITGEVDEEGIDKWYEGKDKIKEKIKEKVKQKDKNSRDKDNGEA